MVAARRQCALVLATFASLLIISIPYLRLEGSRYTKPLKGLLPGNVALPENHMPSEDQKVTYGHSNVWETGAENIEAVEKSLASRNSAMKSTADDVFILLKTGAETMWNRIPVHFNTTMRRFPHIAIYSDMGALLNGHVVHDVLQYLPTWLLNSDSLKGYRVRRASVDNHWGWGPTKLQISGDGAGWQTDRFKNIPAFLHAWEMTNGELPWYFMIDGDTYAPVSTVAAAIKDRDPDGIWYLGHGVGWNPIFAHGGSGILLSRGALRAMFHEPNDIEWHKQIIEDSSKRAQTDCCGDSVVAFEFERLTGVSSDTSLELMHHGLFQGNSISSLRLHEDSWCSPVGTFHHVSTAETQILFNWESMAMSRKAAKGDFGPLLNADFYEDFVEPFIAEERDGWYFDSGHDENLAIVSTPSSPAELWDGSVKLDTVGQKADCRRGCELNEACMAWEWLKDMQCRLFVGEFSMGVALNSFSPAWEPPMTEVAAGHMLERINAVHRNSPCRATESQTTGNHSMTPGWFHTARENSFETELTRELVQRPLPIEQASTVS